MKRWICFVWCLILTLSLCACAGETRETGPVEDPRIAQLEADLAEAEERMKNGDYEIALSILQNNELYRQISDAISEAEAGRQEQWLSEYDGLFGKTWYATDRDMQVTFRREPDRAGNLVMEYRVMVNEQGVFTERKGEIPCSVEDGPLILRYITDFDSVVATDVPVIWREENGKEYLYLNSIQFEPESAAKPAGVEMVEITMDNWQEYFEIKTAEIWEKDDFGDVSGLILTTYVGLKDEYMNRVDLPNSHVMVGYSYSWKLMNCSLNLEERSYQLGGVRGTYGATAETFELPNKLGHYKYDLPDYLGGFYYGNYDFIMNVISQATDYQITKITGTLAIRG